MGMYDNVIVAEKNSLGIKEGIYQTKSLQNGLDFYLISTDNRLVLSKFGTDEPLRYHDKLPEKLPSVVSNVYGCIAIYNEHNKYYLLIDDNIIKEIVTENTYNYFDLNDDFIEYLPVDDLDFFNKFMHIMDNYSNSEMSEFILLEIKAKVEEALYRYKQKYKYANIVFYKNKLFLSYAKEDTKPTFIKDELYGRK